MRFCGGETEKYGEKCAARRKEKQKKGLRLLFLCNREEFLFSPPVSYLDKADEIYYNKKLER